VQKTVNAGQSYNKKPVAYAFIYVNSPQTKIQYPKRLKLFFDFIGLKGDLEEQGTAFLKQARQDETWASEQLMFFMDHHKQRVLKKEISAGTLHNLLKPIKAFLDAYRDVSITIDWRRIKKALPRAKIYANDRAPSIDEIRKLVEFPDRRIKPMVYTMCSSGIRIGAWDFMKWEHITPIKDEKTSEIKAAKLLVYPGEGEEYITFITPEAYRALKDWMDFRASYGEQITPSSWVMRTVWRTADMKRKSEKNPSIGNMSRINEPEKLTAAGINRIFVRALYEEGIRDELPQGIRRHPFKGVHGLRKWFKTRAEQAMLRTNVEYIIGHSLGISQSYYRPTEYELLTDYLKAVPYLSINDDNAIDIKNLKEKQQLLLKMSEHKDTELQELRAKMDIMAANMASFMEYMSGAKELVDIVGLNGDIQDKGSEEERKQDLFKTAAIARAKIKARGKKNAKVQMIGDVMEVEEEEKKSKAGSNTAIAI
jgi:integrase